MYAGRQPPHGLLSEDRWTQLKEYIMKHEWQQNDKTSVSRDRFNLLSKLFIPSDKSHLSITDAQWQLAHAASTDCRSITQVNMCRRLLSGFSSCPTATKSNALKSTHAADIMLLWWCFKMLYREQYVTHSISNNSKILSFKVANSLFDIKNNNNKRQSEIDCILRKEAWGEHPLLCAL